MHLFCHLFLFYPESVLIMHPHLYLNSNCGCTFFDSGCFQFPNLSRSCIRISIFLAVADALFLLRATFSFRDRLNPASASLSFWQLRMHFFCFGQLSPSGTGSILHPHPYLFGSCGCTFFASGNFLLPRPAQSCIRISSFSTVADALS